MVRHAGDDRQQPAFLFATCQVGAERALKSEVAREWPPFRLSFSRPGFLTFKLPDHDLPRDFDLGSVFARTWGFSLGKVEAPSVERRAIEFCDAVADRSFDALHVWQRDTATPGVRGFEPHITPEAHAAEAAIRRVWLERASDKAPLATIAQPGQLVLDCTLVEAERWWVGYHRADAGDSRFPGGLREIALPSEAVSRAYLKMEDALAWSGLPIRPGQRVVEIGCAPGGASQALLAHGLKVIGIDPARVDPRVLANRNFTHIQKRGSEVRRRELRGVTWLTADMNVAPRYTLDTVESLVTHPAVNVRGLLLTLKLLNWELAEEIPSYLERIRGWGYAQVRARQLAHNRQEICVTVLRRKPAERGRAS